MPLPFPGGGSTLFLCAVVGAAVRMAFRRVRDQAAVRAWETQMTAGGEHVMVCAAVHHGTGTIVAATVVTGSACSSSAVKGAAGRPASPGERSPATPDDAAGAQGLVQR
ncbi:hypothetical protein GCM10022252_12080 [Streptosporangium oxazolinicum]|uniref:Uncharacterized protein n=1 Tax=Streptosporangium oxazolinicum TaxID=909287 RepID=A0ABP8AHA5_9ACTN